MISSNQYGVIISLSFFIAVWCAYNTVFRPVDPNTRHIMAGCLYRIPEHLRVLFPFVNRHNQVENETCIDKWSLGHFSLYLVTGAVFPAEYTLVLVASVACEVFEYAARYRAKLSDVAVNMAGYVVGSMLHHCHGLRLQPAPTWPALCALAAAVAALLGTLYVHRRRMLHRLGNVSTTEDFVSERDEPHCAKMK